MDPQNKAHGARREKKDAATAVVDSLATALRLLNFFSVEEPELSLTQLADRTGMYKSRIHRLCGTLVVMGFLVRTSRSGYRLGPRLMVLGKVYEKTNTLVSVSLPIMKGLARETGESVALFALDGTASFCLARVLGTSRLVFSINEGDYMHLHASAAGRVLLAYGPETLADAVLEATPLSQFTPLTLTDPHRIRAELSAIRQRGYAVNKGETELEVAAVAAPLFCHEAIVNEALAVVGPAQRFTDDTIRGIGVKLLKATAEISRLQGGGM